MKRILLSITVAILSGCATSNTQLVWQKPGGTEAERDQCLAAAKVAAIQAYPDPMSQAQIYSESIAAPTIRRMKREEVIVNSMASNGWKVVEIPKSN